MQLTKEYFDSALGKLKKELKTELKTEIKEELIPLITNDVIEKLQPKFDDIQSQFDQVHIQFNDVYQQFNQIRSYMREVADEVLLAVGTDVGEIREVTNEILLAVGTDSDKQEREGTSLGDRTDRLEIRMTVVEKAIAKSNL